MSTVTETLAAIKQRAVAVPPAMLTDRAHRARVLVRAEHERGLEIEWGADRIVGDVAVESPMVRAAFASQALRAAAKRAEQGGL